MSMDLRLKAALNAPRLNSLRAGEIIPEVTRLIQQVYVMVGFNIPVAADLCILTAKLSTDLQESYGGLTLQEISLCFEYGAKGEYGDIKGINLRTLSGWLKAYRRSDRRYRAVVEREREQQTALPPLSEAYKEERERVFLERIFRQYREGVSLERLFPAQVYRMLQQREIINDLPAIKWRAIELAQQKYKARARIHMPEEIRQTLVKQEAMTICLQAFFDRIVGEGRKSLFDKSQPEHPENGIRA